MKTAPKFVAQNTVTGLYWDGQWFNAAKGSSSIRYLTQRQFAAARAVCPDALKVSVSEPMPAAPVPIASKTSDDLQTVEYIKSINAIRRQVYMDKLHQYRKASPFYI